MGETLNHIPWELAISSSDLNDSVTKFQDLLLSAIAEHVPLITLRGRSRPPWITSEVMKLVRKKKTSWKRLRRNNCPELFSRFKQLRKQTKKCTAASYHHYLQSLSEKLKVDGIPARTLKIYAKELSWPLTYLFNLSFTLGEVPLIWKRANITPVFKANAKENVENYRSISLLSILGKCQERIVHRVVYSHLSPFLNDWQHGFVKGRSCITQLVLTHHMWHKALDDGLQVDAVFLDFTKAFDRVVHKILLNKLCNFGISGSLLEWCSDYLSNRTQRVVIDGNCSS